MEANAAIDRQAAWIQCCLQEPEGNCTTMRTEHADICSMASTANQLENVGASFYHIILCLVTYLCKGIVFSLSCALLK